MTIWFYLNTDKLCYSCHDCLCLLHSASHTSILELFWEKAWLPRIQKATGSRWSWIEKRVHACLSPSPWEQIAFWIMLGQIMWNCCLKIDQLNAVSSDQKVNRFLFETPNPHLALFLQEYSCSHLINCCLTIQNWDWTNDVLVMIFRCGHMCCCITCSSHLTNCPLCRQRINQVVKTFRHWCSASIIWATIPD